MGLVAQTARLQLHHFSADDAAFILELVNQPAWLEFIGDKGVHDLDGARAYLRDGPLAMYARCGHGLYRVDLAASGQPIGMCGLIKRDTLEDVDIGYAFLPAHWGQGYAREAARATLQHARDAFGLARIVAITSPANARSIRLLHELGLRFAQTRETSPGDTTSLYAIDF